MAKRSTMVGLDVHKETIDVVVAEPGAEGEVRHFGTIGGDLASVGRMVKALRATGRRLHFVYQAGPCGFHLYRHLQAQGLECTVVSPSMTPKRSGDRIKTDRRDAEALARLHRARELRAIYIPGPDDEAFTSSGPGRTRSPARAAHGTDSRHCCYDTATATRGVRRGRFGIGSGCPT